LDSLDQGLEAVAVYIAEAIARIRRLMRKLALWAVRPDLNSALEKVE